MALPPRDGSSSPADFSELNAELRTAREALVRFADAAGALVSLICDASDPACRYPDAEWARRHASVDELLQAVAALPDSDEEVAAEEGRALYPLLLQLAELFDVLIDQYSLVYGDSVALAESMAKGWHQMAGCFDHRPTAEEAAAAMIRMTANVGEVTGALEAIDGMPPEARHTVVQRFRSSGIEPLTAEARHLALHAVDTWLTEGVGDARVVEAIQPARVRPGQVDLDDSAAVLRAARADLLLARLSQGVCRNLVPETLVLPFADVLPAR